MVLFAAIMSGKRGRVELDRDIQRNKQVHGLAFSACVSASANVRNGSEMDMAAIFPGSFSNIDIGNNSPVILPCQSEAFPCSVLDCST